MKKYTFSKEICYSKRLKARTHLKYALTCSLSVLFSAGLVVGLWKDRDHLPVAGDVKTYTPAMSDYDRLFLKNGWEKAIKAVNLFSKE